MFKGRKIFWMAVCLVLCLMVHLGTAEAEDVIRIGIMRFQNRAADLTNDQAASITDIFTRMLASSRSIAIIERDQLAAIGREHKLNMSGLVDTGTAVEIGRIAGCQYMLLGAVTQFSKNVTDQKFVFIQETKYDASVTVDMRVVDVATSEVVLTLAETGSAVRTDSAIDLGKDINQRQSNLEGLEGEAISNAVSKLGQRIREVVAGEYSQVLSAAGKEITLNVGAASGAQMGGRYLVYADGPEVLDMNGRVIDRKRLNIAVIRIVEVQNGFSVANIVSGGGKPANVRRGDKITPISPSEASTLVKKKMLPDKRPRTRASLDGVDLGDRMSQIAGERGVNGTDNPSPEPVLSQVSEPTPPVDTVGTSQGKGIVTPKRERENQSTDPAKVIATYGLSSGEANTRRIAHLGANRLGNKQAAYDKFVELAGSFSGDYLAAYRAGVVAQNMGNRDDAKTWFDKALAINPNYEPAQEAKKKLESAPAQRSKSKRRK